MKHLPIIRKSFSYYSKYGRFAPIVFFFGGFAWDNLTLTRIDRVSDNLILFAYLSLLGGLIVLVNLIESGNVRKPFLLRFYDWYPLGIQFLFGGLLSSYVVFYFKSASLSKTAIFVVILAILLVANEFLENRLKNLYLQISLYFFVSFSFFIFAVPVAVKKMSTFTFVSGGILSLLASLGLLFFIFKKSGFVNRQIFVRASVLTGILFVLLNLFYWQNWIPPVPLSLKEGAIYHQVVRQGDFYRLKFEKPHWYQCWRNSDDPFRYAEGDTVFCFTAVFAPTMLKKDIFHVWQKYSPVEGEWLQTDRLSHEVTGGRQGGYRGYTYKRNISPGKWRVDVVTEENLILGTIKFEIEKSAEKVAAFKVIYR